MKLIVGLGNQGEKYQNNRHNVGFMFVDYLLEQCQNPKSPAKRDPAPRDKIQNKNPKFKINQKLKSEITEININNKKFILVKPQMFINQSGQAVKSCIARYKLDMTRDLYLVHDDLDIKLGELKIQKAKGPKLHNGVLSVEEALGTSDFWRVRVGIDNRDPEKRIVGEAYVLQNFKEEEKKPLIGVFEAVAKSFDIFF